MDVMVDDVMRHMMSHMLDDVMHNVLGRDLLMQHLYHSGERDRTRRRSAGTPRTE